MNHRPRAQWIGLMGKHPDRGSELEGILGWSRRSSESRYVRGRICVVYFRSTDGLRRGGDV
jgi:hypothetical protein